MLLAGCERVRGKGKIFPTLLLYLYRACNKITQLSIPTHAQLQRHRLKFIKNLIKKLLHVSVYDHLQGVTMSSLKSLLFLPHLDGRRPKHVGVLEFFIWFLINFNL